LLLLAGRNGGGGCGLFDARVNKNNKSLAKPTACYTVLI
jgi:hypothetical protein